MDLPADMLAPPALWLGHAGLLALVAAAVQRVPVAHWISHARSHVYLGSCVGVLVLWQMKAGIPPFPDVHLLGATLLTLMFGWRAALAGLLAVLTLSTLNGAGSWASFGTNALLMAALPVLSTHALRVLVQRKLPANPFVYIFVSGFAAAALSMALVGLASAALLGMASGLEAASIVHGYLVSYVLLVFPEAFVTGMLLAWLVMFYPQWVVSYEDPQGAR